MQGCIERCRGLLAPKVGAEILGTILGCMECVRRAWIYVYASIGVKENVKACSNLSLCIGLCIHRSVGTCIHGSV